MLKYRLLILAFFVMTVFHAGGREETPRLAVGAYRGGVIDEGLTELLTVSLAAEPDMAVVDRTLLARLIAEWQLGAMSGNSREALEMGRLQGVDYFVWIELPPDGMDGFLEVVATATGYGMAGVRTPTEIESLRDFVIRQVKQLPADVPAPAVARALAISLLTFTPETPENAAFIDRLLDDLSGALINARVPLLHRRRIEQLVSEGWRAQKGVVELTDHGRGLRGAGAILIPRVSFETSTPTLELALVDAVTGTRSAAAEWVLSIDNGRLVLPTEVSDWVVARVAEMEISQIISGIPDADRMQPETQQAFYHGVLLFNEGRYLDALDHFAKASVTDMRFPQPVYWIQACFAAAGFEEVVERLDAYFERVTTRRVLNIPFYQINWRALRQTPGVNLLGVTCRDPELAVHGGRLLDGLLAELDEQGHGPVFLSDDLAGLKHEYDALVGIETAADAGWRRAPLLLFENMVSAHLSRDGNDIFLDTVIVPDLLPKRIRRVRIQLGNDQDQWREAIRHAVSKLFDPGNKRRESTLFHPMDGNYREISIAAMRETLREEWDNAAYLKLLRRHPVAGSRSGEFKAPAIPYPNAWPSDVLAGIKDWLARVLPDNDPGKAALSVSEIMGSVKLPLTTMYWLHDYEGFEPREALKRMDQFAERFPDHPVGLLARYNRLLIGLEPHNYRQRRHALSEMLQNNLPELNLDRNSAAILGNTLRTTYATLSIALNETYEPPVSTTLPLPRELTMPWFSRLDNWSFVYSGFLFPVDGSIRTTHVFPPQWEGVDRVRGEETSRLYLQLLPEILQHKKRRPPFARAQDVLKTFPGSTVAMDMAVHDLRSPVGMEPDAFVRAHELFSSELVRFFNDPSPPAAPFRPDNWLISWSADAMNELPETVLQTMGLLKNEIRSAALRSFTEGRYADTRFRALLAARGWWEPPGPTGEELYAAAAAEWQQFGHPGQAWLRYLNYQRTHGAPDKWRKMVVDVMEEMQTARSQWLRSQRARHSLAFIGMQLYRMHEDELADRIHEELSMWPPPGDQPSRASNYRGHAWNMRVLTAHRAGNLPRAFRLAQEALNDFGENSRELMLSIDLAGARSRGGRSLRAFVNSVRGNPALPFHCPIEAYHAGNQIAQQANQKSADTVRHRASEALSAANSVIDAEVANIIDGIEKPEALADIALKHPQWAVRTEVARKIDDADQLMRLVLESRDSHIRHASLLKLNDQHLLARVATDSHEWRLRRDAVQRLEESGILARIAVKDAYWAVRVVAVQKLNDPELLARIAVDDPDRDVRVAAAVEIENQSVLEIIAANDVDPCLRIVAVLKLDDQNLLGRIASKDDNEHVRMAAARRVNDRKVMEDEGRWFSLNVVRRITDSNVLTDLIHESRNLGVRSMALYQMNDQDLKTRIAMENVKEDVGLNAVERIDDQEWLTNAVLESPHARVRKTAMAKVTDQALLAVIARLTTDWDIRVAALERLTAADILDREGMWFDPVYTSKITDQTLLRKIATEAHDTYARRAAVERLDDRAMLADIAVNDGDAYVRQAAVERIDDWTLLEKIAANDIDRHVRRVAAKRIHAMRRADLDTLSK